MILIKFSFFLFSSIDLLLLLFFLYDDDDDADYDKIFEAYFILRNKYI